jgi:ubiquinone/menaquinone biosynthesis C-methylase UbiE
MLDVTQAVKARYSAGARERQAALCCPVHYDPGLLALLPAEILEKDYGCGDPTPFVRPGDTILDLGSGGGKICYLAAQLVGEQGRAIGVDMNDDMLALARRYQPEMAARLGGDRVAFHKARIEDLALSLEAVADYLRAHPIQNLDAYLAFQHWQAEERAERPLIADASVDLIVSNCVLNLVADSEKGRMMAELYRVLKPGGRIALSDICADEAVPAALKQDPALWSCCIAGSFQELEFLRALEKVGFLGLRIHAWAAEPWQSVAGVEFRSLTVTAVKGASSPCLDLGQAVVYRGPFRSVTDDEGHEYPRGERMAVCERTYRLLTGAGPYQGGPGGGEFIGIEPQTPAAPRPWCTPPGTRRPAAETKAAAHRSDGGECCGPSDGPNEDAAPCCGGGSPGGGERPPCC